MNTMPDTPQNELPINENADERFMFTSEAVEW